MLLFIIFVKDMDQFKIKLFYRLKMPSKGAKKAQKQQGKKAVKSSPKTNVSD